MKRLYDFITKANQVLLFLSVLGIGGFIGFMVYNDSRHSFREPQVPVARTSEEAKMIKVDDLQYLGRTDGYYVLGLRKRMVGVPSDTAMKPGMQLCSPGYAPDERAELVNVVFAQGGKRVRTLLPADGLVLGWHLATRSRDESFEFHRFRCIREDANRDGVLDSKDRTDLVILSRDLKVPEFMIQDVVDSDVLSFTELLVKVVDGTGIHFFEVDCEARTQTEVVWK